jgi:hypothetical protein
MNVRYSTSDNEVFRGRKLVTPILWRSTICMKIYFILIVNNSLGRLLRVRDELKQEEDLRDKNEKHFTALAAEAGANRKLVGLGCISLATNLLIRWI